MDPLRVGLRVGQRQGRTPRAAEQHPFFNAQVFADALKVFHQIPGGVVFQAGVRGGATAAALVEGDDAIQIRIEIASALGVAAGAGATVDEYDRQSFRRAAFIDVQRMGVIDSQIVPGVRFDLRKQSLHCALRKGSRSSLGGLVLFCRWAS